MAVFANASKFNTVSPTLTKTENMKLIFSLLLTSLLFAACKNDRKITQTIKNENGSTTTTSVDMASLTSNAEDISDKMEKLKKLTPLSLDQLKSLLPEEVNGIKRSSFNANSTMGFSIAEAEYKKDDQTDLKLVVYDCAGEAGAGIFALSYWTKMNMQSESADGYVKTVDFKGTKAVETFEKGNNESSLTYVGNDRLLVVITGKNMDQNAVRDVAQKLDLKSL